MFLALAACAPVPARAASTHAELAKDAHGSLPFITDDYSKALAEARARKVPLFVESWAPW
jgi:hypothetical protein